LRHRAIIAIRPGIITDWYSTPGRAAPTDADRGRHFRASLADLMARMGHDSPAAAMIYQHASRQADQAIADAVSGQVKAEQKRSKAAAQRPSRRRAPDPRAPD
jgi:hypothetical protein